MARNGRHSPRRPRLEVRQAAASPEEAAAIAGAIEQFLRDTAPAPAPPTGLGGWARAAVVGGVGIEPEAARPWGDPEPWGRSSPLG